MRIATERTRPDDDLLDIDCSRCGRTLRVRLADLGAARFVECEACSAKPPFNKRQVFVAFDSSEALDPLLKPPLLCGEAGGEAEEGRKAALVCGFGAASL